MSAPIVFYSRCRPKEKDAIEIVLSESRVFIGWPLQRPGSSYDPHHLHDCVVDLACSDEEWEMVRDFPGYKKQYSQNRNFVKQVSVGAIALVPRPSSGVIYCGKVDGAFELINDPPWYRRYMEIRGDQDGDEKWHAADVAQCWHIDNFRPIPFPKIPAWIRGSLLGRSTYGVIYPDEFLGDPHEKLERIINNDAWINRGMTLDEEEIGRRLLEDVTPSVFEHLVVSLLQLEFPDDSWIHVGGSGDGGVDGMGVGPDGNVRSILQCKWQYGGEDVFSGNLALGAGAITPRKFLASLRYPNDARPHDIEFLDRPTIAHLIVKHWQRLPLAISLHIGKITDPTAQ